MQRRTRSREEPEIQRSVDPPKGIQLLKSLLEKAQQLLTNRPIQRGDHLAWQNTTKDYLIRTFGSESQNIHAVISAPSSIPSRLGMTDIGYERYEASKLENQIKMLQSCIEQLEADIIIGESVESKETLTPGSISKVLHICKKFPVVAKQLTKRHNKRPPLQIEDEYDVQDLLHSLLRIDFDDVRAEEWVPSYAGGASKMDFLLKREKIVVEVKKTRKNLADKEIGEQLLVDIAKYKQHPDCRTLLCFVYDPEGIIANPAGLENDLKKLSDGEMEIITVIVRS